MKPSKPTPRKKSTAKTQSPRRSSAVSTSDEKIQKVLAQEGIASRREIEKWIEAGRIKVNGKVAHLGQRVTEQDNITVDKRRVKRTRTAQKTRVILYHKPEGEICTNKDPEKRPTVFDHLPPIQKGRWIAVGRLDINSSGAILFTNDGELANKLMHPRHQIEREYAVRVLGAVTKDMIQNLLEGVMLEDGKAKFEVIEDAGGEGVNHWYHVIVKSGRNRMVRRIWESQGLKVSRLTRVRYGTIVMGRALRPGRYTELNIADIQSLKELAVKTNTE